MIVALIRQTATLPARKGAPPAEVRARDTRDTRDAASLGQGLAVRGLDKPRAGKRSRRRALERHLGPGRAEGSSP